MILSKDILNCVFGGTAGTDSPTLPPREAQAAEQQKVESSSIDPTAPVEPPKP